MDPRIELLDSFDFEKSKINHHSGFILLCGGEYDSDHSHTLSARDYLLKHPTKPAILELIELAEAITDWFKEEAYRDLISFEKDVAELAGLIVIFVESPGSIAEFSAFSQIEGLREKLLIFIDDELSRKDSFIVLGPLKSLQISFPDSVRPYPWMVSHGATFRYEERLMSDCIGEIVDDIMTSYLKLDHKADFACANHRHILLVISDLIDLMLALTLTEIESFLPKFGIEIDRRRLQQCLFILEKMRLIAIKQRGKKYYVPLRHDPLVSYSLKDGTIFDRNRVKAVVSNYYKENDVRRASVIRDLFRENRGSQ